jgi:tRNA nucleotidyltransferase/poly(A) polymerase
MKNLEEDLKHRDFTINAMAYDPLGEVLIDPYDGQADLKGRTIRGVEDPLKRFMEDGLRPYRAIRFSVTLGYPIERTTYEAIPLALDQVRTTSWERVRDEILKMLEAPRPSAAFEMMKETGLLAICLPELAEASQTGHESAKAVYRHLLCTVDMAPPRPLLRLACLFHGIGKATGQRDPHNAHEFPDHHEISAQTAAVVARRLRLSNHQRKYVHQLIMDYGVPLPEVLQGPPLRRFLARIGTSLLTDLFAMIVASRKASAVPRSEIQALHRLKRKTEEILTDQPPLTVSQLAIIRGDEVKRLLRITEGVEVGRILSKLLDVVLESPEKNNPQDLRILLKDIEGQGIS